MRVVVTGAAGFIGRAVVAAARRRGIDVVAVDSLRPDVHRSAGAPGRIDDAPPMIRADVRDAAALAGPLAGAGAVVHLAAKVGLGVDLADIDDYVSSNDLGTAVLLRVAAQAGVRRIVLASSMVVYGEGVYTCASDGRVSPGPRQIGDLDAGRFDPPCPRCGGALQPGLVDEEQPLDPRNVYAATKVHQEHLAASWARETGGTVAAMRFHNVYGPGMPRDTPYAGVAAIFRSELAAGRPPAVHEDGAQRRDFVHVGDVAAAVVAAVAPSGPAGAAPFRAYNVGSGTVSTIGEVAALLAQAVGGPAPVLSGRYRAGDVRHITASSDRAGAELGWVARVAPASGLALLGTGPAPAST